MEDKEVISNKDEFTMAKDEFTMNLPDQPFYLLRLND